MSSARMLNSRVSSTTRTATPATRHSTPPSNDSPPTTFSNVSPIHGVGRAAQGSTPIRAFYIALVVAALAVTLVCVGFTLDDIINNPSTVTTKVQPRTSLDLPKVTICNLNPLLLSSFSTFEDYVETLDDSDDSEVEAVYFGSGKECAMCIDGEIDPGLFREKYSALPSNLKASYGHQLADMLMSCEFQGQSCSASDFTAYVDDYYGNCFSFNNLTVSSAGSLNGLILELDTQPHEYIPHVSETVGIRVLLEPQSTPSCPRSQDIAISPGQDSFVSLRSSMSTGPCANSYVTVSSGLWPTSTKKSNSLASTATPPTMSTTAGNGATLTPTLEDIEGSGGGAVGPSRLIGPGDGFLHSMQKRDAEILSPGNSNTPETPTPEKALNQNQGDASRAGSPFNNGVVQILKSEYKAENNNMEVVDDSVFNNNGRDNKNSGGDNDKTAPTILNQSNNEEYWRAYPDTINVSERPSLDDNENYLERFRRATGDSDADNAMEESNKTDTTSTARDRFSKCRVFYSSLDEEIESTSKRYPWYIATALIGGQFALFCSLSVIAIIEGIECAIRFIGRSVDKYRPNNKIGVRYAWE